MGNRVNGREVKALDCKSNRKLSLVRIQLYSMNYFLFLKYNNNLNNKTNKKIIQNNNNINLHIFILKNKYYHNNFINFLKIKKKLIKISYLIKNYINNICFKIII